MPCLALDVCKTQNQTRDRIHGGAGRTAPLPACRKRPFTTHADRLRPRLKGRRRLHVASAAIADCRADSKVASHHLRGLPDSSSPFRWGRLQLQVARCSRSKTAHRDDSPVASPVCPSATRCDFEYSLSPAQRREHRRCRSQARSNQTDREPLHDATRHTESAHQDLGIAAQLSSKAHNEMSPAFSWTLNAWLSAVASLRTPAEFSPEATPPRCHHSGWDMAMLSSGKLSKPR